MKLSQLLFVVFAAAVSPATAMQETSQLHSVEGLRDTVEIRVDKWGIAHIYAQNQHDLFFAQGYNAARDRLFQFEMWRRRATGTLAEIQGEKALQHDIGARLLRFRGDMKAEMAHYHKDSTEIITAFIDGINAYITQTEANPELLPIEFGLLGIKPDHWTPEVLLSRHNALAGGLANEIMLSKSITAVGPDRTKQMLNMARTHSLETNGSVDLSKITSEVMALYKASRKMPAFTEDDLRVKKATRAIASRKAPQYEPLDIFEDPLLATSTLGSNNWLISGQHTATGHPILANDPHRAIELPSLRYWVHLNAPGWNVIGGGEPVLPGVSIGHNDHGAWGLTIFWIDQEDLYVYETNPKNTNQYLHNGSWHDMETEQTDIDILDAETITHTLKYTVHGPVLYEDKENNLAYALKAAWLEVGAAPYLASLRMDQAQTWEEFVEACTYSGLPGENMIWADKSGNIGWQAVGLTPKRNGWSGTLPVPGDGSYEWQGYVPIMDMPRLTNPKNGWFGTANYNNVPEDYPNVFADFYSDPGRTERLTELMSGTEQHSIQTSIDWQFDTQSVSARKLIPLFEGLNVTAAAKEALDVMMAWDQRIEHTSTGAAIYTQWETMMLDALKKIAFTEEEAKSIPSLKPEKITEWLLSPPTSIFGDNPEEVRDQIIINTFAQVVEKLRKELGDDLHSWTYGKIHHAQLIHPLSHLVGPELQTKLNTVALPTSGTYNTLNLAYGSTYGAKHRTVGGTFRFIADVSDWEKSVGTSAPGQSGNPDSSHYKDLFHDWNEANYFPLAFSRERVAEVTQQIIRLSPAN